MKVTSFVGQVAAALAFSAAAPALAWPSWLPHADALVARQEEQTSATATAATTATMASGTMSPTASSPTASSSSNQAETTNLNTADANTTGSLNTASANGSNQSTATTTSHQTFNVQDPAGSVVMVTPAPIAGATQLYRIGENVTWGWNYTGIQAAPTAIDVLVTCTAQTLSWTLTTNMTYETSASYTWDTGAFQTANIATPLAVDMYKIMIYEAGSSVSATAEAGYLAPFTNFQFGLYTGRPYKGLDQDWVCATCSSGALSDTERRVVGAAVVMSLVTVLSFTWFVTGFAAFL